MNGIDYTTMHFGLCTTLNEGFMISKESDTESSKYQSIGLLKSTPTQEDITDQKSYESGDDLVLADEFEGW